MNSLGEKWIDMKIESCPGCGSEASIVVIEGDFDFIAEITARSHVQCTRCGFMYRDDSCTPEEIIRGWNRRNKI